METEDWLPPIPKMSSLSSCPCPENPPHRSFVRCDDSQTFLHIRSQIEQMIPELHSGPTKSVEKEQLQILKCLWVSWWARKIKTTNVSAAAAAKSLQSNSVWPHRQRPTRLPRPWDSPGKNTGVGCHFLLQCVKGKSESEVAQSCPTLGNHYKHVSWSPTGQPIRPCLYSPTHSFIEHWCMSSALWENAK